MSPLIYLEMIHQYVKDATSYASRVTSELRVRLIPLQMLVILYYFLLTDKGDASFVDPFSCFSFGHLLEKG